MADRIQQDRSSYHGFIEILESEGQWTDHVVRQLRSYSVSPQKEQPPPPAAALQGEKSTLGKCYT